MLAPPAQAWQVFHLPLPVPNLDMVQVRSRFHPCSNQTAVHRIRVPLHVDQTARIHLYLLPFGRLHPPRRQLPHYRQFFGQPRSPACIPLHKQVLEKLRIFGEVPKVTAPAQQQRLLHRALKPVVTLLGIAILIRAGRIGVLRLHAVVPHHPFIAAVELLQVAHVIDRARQAVGAVFDRYCAQFPHRVLPAFTEALQALGIADRARLPVRVRQHEVVHQVLERLSRERDPQLRHVREVRRAQPPRHVYLTEIHFVRGSFRNPP